ncbi:MAG TPA: hypothetical protein VIK93_08875 [Limnochordales bacterium]
MPRAMVRRLWRGGRVRLAGVRRRMARRIAQRVSLIRRAAALRGRLVGQRVVRPAVMAESAPVASMAPVGAPEMSLEDPLTRATRAELRQWVGQRVQLLLAANAVPEITPWDTDGILVSVGESLITLRPGHGPNAGAEIRYALQGLMGFIPLIGMDPAAPRWEAVTTPGPAGSGTPGSTEG